MIDPHAPVDGKLEVIHNDWSETANAAGGIWSNLEDMCKWVIMQMNNGRYGEGLSKHLFSEEVHEEMWSPHTIIPVHGPSSYNTHFAAYGLGWFLSDVKGYKQAMHTGGLAGIVTQVTLIPELKLGIIVFTNQQSGAAFTAVTNTIKDSYLGVKGIDRVKEQKSRVDKAVTEAKKNTDEVWAKIEAQQKHNSATVDFSIYAGTYRDPWFGDVVVTNNNGKPWFYSKRSPKLSGQLLYYKGNTFIAKWNDRSMDADAFVIFCLDAEGKAAGIKMEAISPLTDFSFDFQDLDFKKVDMQ